MPSTAGRETAVSGALPARPRLRLRPDHSGPSLLDGGWWPRSADPAAELPGLIEALDERHGRITRVMLGVADWNASRPHRLQFGGTAGGRIVRLGWFASMPAGLLTAISASGQRTDLLTVPPDTSEQDASVAMDQAARDGNRDHAPAILAGITAAASRAVGAAAADATGSVQLGVWEWEGGQMHGHEAAHDRSRPVSGAPARAQAGIVMTSVGAPGSASG
jgi:uncharacterized protein DUF5994